MDTGILTQLVLGTSLVLTLPVEHASIKFCFVF